MPGSRLAFRVEAPGRSDQPEEPRPPASRVRLGARLNPGQRTNHKEVKGRTDPGTSPRVPRS